MADDIVEHEGVVGIHPVIIMKRRGVRTVRHIFMREHGMHSGQGAGLLRADGFDPGVRVRGPQHLEMDHALDLDVGGVARRTGHDVVRRGILQAGAAGVAGAVLLHRANAVQRILDRMVSGAPAEIALETEGEILLLLLAEAGGRHDHARRAEAALECLRVQKRLLHRMQFPVAGQSLDRGHLTPLGAVGRHETTVNRLAVEPDRTGAAIPAVAPLLYAKPSEITGEGAQTLAGPRLGRKGFSVDFVAHGRESG